jgi:hypothetical protein
MSLESAPKRAKRTLSEFPDLLRELHPTKNDIDSAKRLLSGSKVKLHWICAVGHEWVTSVIHRATNGSKCRVCFTQNRIKHHEKREEIQQRRGVKTLPSTTIQTGDTTEAYVSALLKQHPDVNSVNDVGASGSACDHIVTMSTGRVVQMQVKTLTDNGPNYGKTSCKSGYDPNMLIAFVNLDRTGFGLIYAKNIVTLTTITVNYNRSKNQQLKTFRDPKQFVQSLVAMLPHSTPFKSMSDTLAPNLRKEYEMGESLKSTAAMHGLHFTRAATNSTEIDGYLGSRAVQLKFTSYRPPAHLTFQVGSHRHGGRLAKHASIQLPYTVDCQFEFLIVQLGQKDSGVSLFPNRFLIIPKFELQERGILMDEATGVAGKCAFYVAPPDHPNHWSVKYWDQWNLMLDSAVVSSPSKGRKRHRDDDS